MRVIVSLFLSVCCFAEFNARLLLVRLIIGRGKREREGGVKEMEGVAGGLDGSVEGGFGLTRVELFFFSFILSRI